MFPLPTSQNNFPNLPVFQQRDQSDEPPSVPQILITPPSSPRDPLGTASSPSDQATPRPYSPPVTGGPSLNFASPLRPTPRCSPRIIVKNKPPGKEKEKEFDWIGESSERIEISYETISHIYGIDFLNIKVNTHGNLHNFFALREQILEIEKILQFIPSTEVKPIRDRILKLLKEKDFELQMAELGLILYYLDRQSALPLADSLLEERASEIHKEVEHYLKTRAQCDDPLIPSGKTHYLLRTFAHMLFTSTTSPQVYNKGGLVALKLLLSRAKYSVASHLQPEHLEHILVVIENILKHPAFDRLFVKRIAVHPELQDAIRIDLKLDREVKIESVHAFYASMMALLSDIRQLDYPNCYAISTLIYVSTNHTYKTLENLIKWLEHGYYICCDKFAIPIRQLLEKRLAYNKDLKVMLSSEKALALTPIAHISDMLSLQHIPSEKKVRSIGETLSTLLKSNAATAKSGWAERLYYAYKFNMLVQLQLAVFEFAYMNEPSHSDDSSYSFSWYKGDLINACMEAMVKCIKFRDNFFFNILREKLERELWLENCQENVEKSGNSIHTSTQVIKKFDGNHEALTSLLENDALRVFHLRDTCYTPLETLSALQKVIFNACREIETGKVEQPGFQQAVRDDTYGDVKQFRLIFSDYIARKIDMPGLTGKDLNKADLLILKQTGGHGGDLLEMIYTISISKENIGGKETVYDFLQELFERVKELNEGFITNARKVMIRSPGCHVWTVSPKSWEMFLNCKGSFRDFVKEKIYKPADAKYDSKVTRETLKKLICRFTQDTGAQQNMLKFFQGQNNLTFGFFRKLLLAEVHEDNIEHARSFIDQEFSKIQITKKELTKILNEVQVRVSSQVFFRLVASLDNQSEQPFVFAHRLRARLIETEVAIVDPYQLELAICKVKNLPLVIELGDLNYVDAHREDPAHLHLVGAFSWSADRLKLYCRDDKQQRPDSMPYEFFQILHPKIREKPQEW
jgi:hypothetical protein